MASLLRRMTGNSSKQARYQPVRQKEKSSGSTSGDEGPSRVTKAADRWIARCDQQQMGSSSSLSADGVPPRDPKCIVATQKVIFQWEGIDAKSRSRMSGHKKHNAKRDSIIKLVKKLAKREGIEKSRVRRTVNEALEERYITPRIQRCSEGLPELKTYLDDLLAHHQAHPSRS